MIPTPLVLATGELFCFLMIQILVLTSAFILITSESEADDELTDYEKQIEKNKMSLLDEVTKAVAELEREQVCLFDLLNIASM